MTAADSSSSDDSDNEGGENKKSDLFGDMSSDDSDNGSFRVFFQIFTNFLEKPKTGLGSDGDSPPRRGDVSPRGSDDEQKQEETRIEVQIPKINTNLGDNIHFVRYVQN